MQQAIEQRGGKRLIFCETGRPLTEGQIACDDDAGALVALSHHVEEQIGLLTPEWQITNLVDHQQSRPDDGPVEVLLQPILLMGGS